MKKLMVVTVVVAILVLCVAALATAQKPKPTTSKAGTAKSASTAKTPAAGASSKITGIVQSVKKDAKGHLVSFVVAITDKTGNPMTVDVTVTKKTEYKGKPASSRGVQADAKVGVVLATGIKGGKGKATMVNIIKAASKTPVKPTPKPQPKPATRTGTGTAK